MTENKRVPWSQMEEYLAVHQKTIVGFVGLKESQVLKLPDIEPHLPSSFQQLYTIITKIMRDNDILPAEEEKKSDMASLKDDSVQNL